VLAARLSVRHLSSAASHGRRRLSDTATGVMTTLGAGMASNPTSYSVAATLCVGLSLAAAGAHGQSQKDHDAAVAEHGPRGRRPRARLLLLFLVLGTLGTAFFVCLYALFAGASRDWVRSLVLGLVGAGAAGAGVIVCEAAIALSGLKRRDFAKVIIVGLVLTLAAAGGFALIASRDTTADPLKPKTTYGPFHVVGTCADRRCGLVQYPEPDDRVTPSDRVLRDTELVRIVCQTRGTMVRLKRDRASQSEVWDRLYRGGFVPDLYVDTVASGGFDSRIPRCRGR
jgi:hypothetical protein